MLRIIDTTNTPNDKPMESVKKKSQGRKRIKMEKIEKLSSRQVTFSKRRSGLFKKASELCVLTGAQIAIVVPSSSKRVFTFGHPSADSVIDRYLGRGNNDGDAPEGFHIGKTKDYDEKYDNVLRDLEVEKNRKGMIEESIRLSSSLSSGLNSNNVDDEGINGRYWWNEDFENMELEEMEEFAMALDGLMKSVSMKADDLRLIKDAALAGCAVKGGDGQGYVGNSMEDVGGGLNLSHHQSGLDAINNALTTTTTATNAVNYDGDLEGFSEGFEGILHHWT